MTPAQYERLVLLIEECSEVQQWACKALRFGMDSSHPHYNNIPNRRLIEQELGDLQAVIELMAASGDISYAAVSDAKAAKRIRLKQYLTHNNLEG